MTENVKKILLVADYGSGDLAFKEVQQRLYELAQKAGEHIHIDTVAVEAFNTAQTAAVVAKAAEDGKYDLIYHNTAPRHDIRKARVNNDGEALAFARYITRQGREVKIIGVDSGDALSVNTFSLLADEGLQGRVLKVKSDSGGSQFRSRDIFPPHVIGALTGDIELGEPVFHTPKPQDKTKVSRALRKAEELLAEAPTQQHSHHGDAGQAYVTIVSARSHIDRLVDEVAGQLGSAEVDALPIKSKGQNWIDAGFLAAQLALNSRLAEKRTLLALPYSPETLQNAENLYEAKLDNGATIITSELHALVFARERLVGDVKQYGREGRSVSLENGAVHIGGQAKPVPASELAQLSLPQEITPVYTDGYGNLKLAIRHDELIKKLGLGENPAGSRATVRVSVGGKETQAVVAAQGFAVDHGELALSKGSSGWPRTRESEGADNFAEIFLRGGNAAQVLGAPGPTTPLDIRLGQVQHGYTPGTVVDGRALRLSAHSNVIALRGI